MPSSVVARYYATIEDTSGNLISLIDDWRSLSFGNIVNDIGYFNLELHADHPAAGKFPLDGLFRVYRSLPGLGITWYQEFLGLTRYASYLMNSNGDEVYRVSGVCPNDLLARRQIAYKAGTIGAYKEAPAIQVMQEYVLENCGSLATVDNGRERDGVIPNFYISADVDPAGYSYYMLYYYESDVWQGEKDFQNLLDVLKDIALYNGIDFRVTNPTGVSWLFTTYPDQLGVDRTNVGLDVNTGMNLYGYAPLIFVKSMGNIQMAEYTYDRTSEANVCFVLGDGDGSTRTVVAVSAPTEADSPWNTREMSRPEGGFQYQMIIKGWESLMEAAAKEQFTFVPLQQPSCAYGIHYSLGDRVVVIHRGIERNQRLIGIEVQLIGNSGEQLTLSFAEVP